MIDHSGTVLRPDETGDSCWMQLGRQSALFRWLLRLLVRHDLLNSDAETRSRGTGRCAGVASKWRRKGQGLLMMGGELVLAASARSGQRNSLLAMHPGKIFKSKVRQ